MTEPYPRFDLEGQVALVTGASRGLGRAIALALANAGADVALGLHDVDRDGGVPAEVEALGRQAMPVQMDITDLGQIREAVDTVVDHFGRLDILVNNAGTGPEAPAEDVVEENYDLTMDVNVRADSPPSTGSASRWTSPARSSSSPRRRPR